MSTTPNPDEVTAELSLNRALRWIDRPRDNSAWLWIGGRAGSGRTALLREVVAAIRLRPTSTAPAGPRRRWPGTRRRPLASPPVRHPPDRLEAIKHAKTEDIAMRQQVKAMTDEQMVRSRRVVARLDEDGRIGSRVNR